MFDPTVLSVNPNSDTDTVFLSTLSNENAENVSNLTSTVNILTTPVVVLELQLTTPNAMLN